MKQASNSMTTADKTELVLLKREEEQMKRYVLKFKIARNHNEVVIAEKTAEQIAELEEFARWRLEQIPGGTNTENLVAKLRSFKIKEWRAQRQGVSITKSIAEEIADEMRQWRELEIQEINRCVN